MVETIYHQQVAETVALGDNELIDRILKGDKNLYAVIIRRYNQRIYRTGMAILNDDNEVEDAMQITYVHAWEALANFARKSSFSTWLTRIMINECLLRIKRRKRHLEMKEETLDRYYLSHEVKNPDTKLLNTELRKILETAISELPDKYRSVFILRELEDLSVAETKACLEISEVNVKVRLNRAKSMLRTALSDVYRSGEIFEFHLIRCDSMVHYVMTQIATTGTKTGTV